MRSRFTLSSLSTVAEEERQRREQQQEEEVEREEVGEGRLAAPGWTGR